MHRNASRPAGLKQWMSTYGFAVCAVLVALVYMVLMTIACADGAIPSFDLAIQEFVVGTMRSDALTDLMIDITALGAPLVLAVLWLALYIMLPQRGVACALGVNVLVIALLNIILKAIVLRPRPQDIALVCESGFSFPSGHAMMATAFFGFIAWYVWKQHRQGSVRWLLPALMILVILAVSMSRVYLGVHFATDVIGGMLVSFAWLCIYVRLISARMTCGV